MARHTKYFRDKNMNLFITGCDVNTEWMLPWFVENFRKHNPNAKLMIFDFGMEGSHFPELRKSLRGNQDKGWFKKPAAMISASRIAKKVCWLDTDCHVKANIEDIFDLTEPNKLMMVEDKPWTKRRGEKWHNSGVVAFEDRPNILDEWASAVAINPKIGDQEVLHRLVREGMRRMIHIHDLPRKYNTLRLDLLDDTAPDNISIMHWTGPKGKDEIRRMMNG